MRLGGGLKDVHETRDVFKGIVHRHRGHAYDVGFTPINHYTCVGQAFKELLTEPVGATSELASARAEQRGDDL